jgi:AraC family transcriptional regulator
LSAPLPRGWPHPQVVPFETLSRRSIEGKCFRFDSQLQDLTGNREFDLQRPEHHLTFYAQGPPMLIAARMDSGPFERFALSPGQVTLLPSGQRAHGWADGLGTRGEMRLSFGPEFISQAIGAEVQASRVELVRSMDLRNPSIVQALAALGREVEQPGPMGRVYTESLVVLVVTELVRHHSTLAVGVDRPEDAPSRRLQRVVDYIESHLGEDLSLLALAAEAGVSAAHFARAFKRAMGRSVHRYLLGRRVEWATALLAGTERSIVDIALATGFSSQAHLTTAFRRLNGTTPAAYRRERRT